MVNKRKLKKNKVKIEIKNRKLEKKTYLHNQTNG